MGFCAVGDHLVQVSSSPQCPRSSELGREDFLTPCASMQQGLKPPSLQELLCKGCSLLSLMSWHEKATPGK